MTWQPGGEPLLHQIGYSTVSCRVPGCNWQHDEPVLDIPESSLAEIFGAGQMRLNARNQHDWNIERVVNQHTESHSKADLMAVINRTFGALPPGAEPVPVYMFTESDEDLTAWEIWLGGNAWRSAQDAVNPPSYGYGSLRNVTNGIRVIARRINRSEVDE